MCFAVTLPIPEPAHQTAPVEHRFASERGGPFYAFLGVALCLYFASQGAGRVLWPVIASVVRLLVIAFGCVVLARSTGARTEHFFWMIAAGMAVQALVSGTAIRLGAWTRGAER